MVRTLGAIVALAAAGAGLWWKGYRVGRRNVAALEALGQAYGIRAGNDAEVRRVLSS